MKAIHDGELCGYVLHRLGTWQALTVFGGLLESADSEEAAADVVRTVGLAALAERWLLSTDAAPDAEIVCIQEASPAGVTVAVGYYSMPGVPTLHVSAAELADGRVRLHRNA